MAIYSTLFSGPVNAALLVFFMAVRQRQLFAGIPLGEALQAVAVTTVLALFFLQLLRVTRRKIKTRYWNGPGKVLLFPCRVSHSRLFPQKHQFSHSYLVAGIPVGFEGNAGGLVSVAAKGKPDCIPWSSLAPRVRKAWYTVDAGDYLERGKAELGLRGKLDEYLQTQGVNPTTYPYAYLVTAARFMGYHFNPASFWYLYDADKRLAAMILEVNNTFDERRMYFLTADDGRTTNEAGQSECSPRNSPRQTTFKQSWPKDFHVSPFNSRKGSYRLAATDPLGPSMQGTGPISITITLVSSKGHPKMIANLSPAGSAAIDPCSMTASQKLGFLASWWWVGLVTYPRILKEAARLFFQRKLHVWFRPEPLDGTISRTPTPTERQLEPIFRRYLQHLVEQSTTPLTVKYTAAAGISSPPQFLLSPTTTTPAEEVELKILTPAFYTRYAALNNNGDFEAFISEQPNDARTIWVSHPDLLAKLAPKKTKKPITPVFTSPSPSPSSWFDAAAVEYACFEMIQRLRRRVRRLGRGVSGMDAYVLEHETAEERARYRGAVLRLVLADMVAFGVVPVLEGQVFLGRACLAWLFSSVLSSVLSSVTGWW